MPGRASIHLPGLRSLHDGGPAVDLRVGERLELLRRAADHVDTRTAGASPSRRHLQGFTDIGRNALDRGVRHGGRRIDPVPQYRLAARQAGLFHGRHPAGRRARRAGDGQGLDFAGLDQRQADRQAEEGLTRPPPRGGGPAPANRRYRGASSSADAPSRRTIRPPCRRGIADAGAAEVQAGWAWTSRQVDEIPQVLDRQRGRDPPPRAAWPSPAIRPSGPWQQVVLQARGTARRATVIAFCAINSVRPSSARATCSAAILPAAPAVFDDDGLAPKFGQLGADGARDQVHAAAGVQAGNDAHGAGGKVRRGLGRCRADQDLRAHSATPAWMIILRFMESSSLSIIGTPR